MIGGVTSECRLLCVGRAREFHPLAAICLRLHLGRTLIDGGGEDVLFDNTHIQRRAAGIIRVLPSERDDVLPEGVGSLHPQLCVRERAALYAQFLHARKSFRQPLLIECGLDFDQVRIGISNARPVQGCPPPLLRVTSLMLRPSLGAAWPAWQIGPPVRLCAGPPAID